MSVNETIVLSELKIENFRGIKNLDIKNITANTIIMGVNGTGKTSVIYSILLFLHAINLDSQRNTATKRVDGIGLSRLFHANERANQSFGDLIYRNVDEEASAACIEGLIFLNTQSDAEHFKCSLKANGELQLTPTVIDLMKSKLHFSYIAPETLFEDPRLEPDTKNDECLTSSCKNIRNRYRELNSVRQNEIKKHLKDLFYLFDDIECHQKQIFVKETKKTSLEIQWCGAALRKIFVALTLLHTLAMVNSEKKILLIEDPETHLYDTLLFSFMSYVKGFTQKYSIQLFVVSNSDCVRRLFSDNEILVLEIDKSFRHIAHHLD